MIRNILVVLALTAFGCEQKPAPDSAGPQTAAQQTSAAKAPEAEKVELAPAIPAADVQAVVDQWLAAQNEGDFARYKDVYAPRFEGIKRVGPRTYRYNREGWLADRERMFKKPMRVEAKDVRVRSSETTAFVDLQQSWSSGKFKDVGPKQLMLTLTPDGPRISREEMLASHVGGGEDENARPMYDPNAFALVTDGAVVLSTAPHREWEVGEARLATRPTTAVRDVDAAATGFADWVGREVDLFGPTGKVCSARVDRLELLARVVPHFGTVANWNGEEGAAKRSDAYVAAAIWRLATDLQLGNGVDLVARLTSGSPSKADAGSNDPCAGALWARPRGGSARDLPASPVDGSTLEDVVASFTDLPGYHAVQTDYDAAGHRGAWHEDPAAITGFTRFGSWVVATARAGYGCGAFEGSFWGIWSRAGFGSLVLQSSEDAVDPLYFAPRAAFAIGEDVFFVEADRVVGRVNGRWTVLHESVPPNFDCDC